MSLVALDGTPLIQIGCAQRQGIPFFGALSSPSAVDATNEAAIMTGQVFWADGASNTVDTSGSSSLGWMSGTSTVFSDGSTVVKVGLAAPDTAAGPPARATNVANVITFDVAAVFTGSGITANAWQESVPTTGTKTIAHGELVCFAVQITNRAGSDAMNVIGMASAVSGTTGQPTWTNVNAAGSYSNQNMLPNAVLTASDGTKGYFYGGFVASNAASVTWNNASAQKEYGNLIQLPFPAKVYGIIASIDAAGNYDAILYSDPLGTPASQRSVSVDEDPVGVGTSAVYCSLFTTPYDIAANTPYVAAIKPTTTDNIIMWHKSFASTAHQNAENGGSASYGVSRDAAAFAATNSGLDRFTAGLLIGGFDNGVSAGGMIRHPGMSGGLNA